MSDLKLAVHSEKLVERKMISKRMVNVGHGTRRAIREFDQTSDMERFQCQFKGKCLVTSNCFLHKKNGRIVYCRPPYVTQFILTPSPTMEWQIANAKCLHDFITQIKQFKRFKCEMRMVAKVCYSCSSNYVVYECGLYCEWL